MNDVDTRRQLGETSLLTPEQSASLLQLHFTRGIDVVTLPPKPFCTRVAAPNTNQRFHNPHESVAYLYLPTRVTVDYGERLTRREITPLFCERFQVLLFSTFKYFKKLQIARRPSSTNDCTASIYRCLVLAKTTKRRREDYKKGGEHSRKLDNLSLCQLL